MIETASYHIAVVVDTLIFFLAIGYLALSLDDVALDCLFYVRALYRRLFGRSGVLVRSALEAKREARIALFVPCWHEADVVEPMLKLALRTIRYTNYEIFVGVYPNDPETGAKVDAVAALFPQVRKVVNPRPGGTTKAQNLNAMFAEMRRREGDAPFDIIVLQDVEDVIHPLSMKVYNAFIPANDMVQIPVFPLPRALRFVTAWTYADEFTENHLKDLVVREAIGAFVPCAGVGCAFSRRCLDALAEEFGGEVFRDGSLTEDYQLSLELKLRKFRVAFVNQPLLDDVAMYATLRRRGDRYVAAFRRRGDRYVATRAYFPHTLRTAIRQKTRWITGICLQTWEMQGWRGPLVVRYALYRDRKGLLGHVLCFAGYPVMLLAFGLSAWHTTDPHVVVATFRHVDAIYDLLYAVIGVSVWRIGQRAIHVGRYYGPLHGLVAIMRYPWGNLVNGCATFCAVYSYLRAKTRNEPLRWAKTRHFFPTDVG